MRFTQSFFFLLSVLFLFGCNRIKSKGQEIASNAKREMSIQKGDLEDKLVRKFDPYHPDTKYNRQRFEDFFNFEPGDDISGIYCYSDELGIDHKYQFSFNCDSATVNRIIKNLLLVKSTAPDDFSSSLWKDFNWWGTEKILKMIPYKRKTAHEIYEYLWYDEEKGKAYYFTFDM